MEVRMKVENAKGITEEDVIDSINPAIRSAALDSIFFGYSCEHTYIPPTGKGQYHVITRAREGPRKEGEFVIEEIVRGIKRLVKKRLKIVGEAGFETHSQWMDVGRLLDEEMPLLDLAEGRSKDKVVDADWFFHRKYRLRVWPKWGEIEIRSLS